jgi:hypothetical protein
MLLNQTNPYRPALPDKLTLDWEDFEFTISAANDRAIGQTADWAVVNYMAADCDLAPFLFDDLIEMKQIGSSAGLHVCAWFDGPLLTDAFFARLHSATPLQDDVVLRFRELKTTDPATLTMALQVAGAYPARRRLLFVSGHGQGWRGVLLDQNLGAAYLTKPGRLKLPGPGAECDARMQRSQRAAQEKLTRSLEGAPAGRPFDILAFDCCDMGNIEAIGYFAAHADIVVTSEDQVPGDGYPYAQVLADLNANLTQTPTDLARALVAQTKRRYAALQDGDPPVTQVAIASAGLPGFARAFGQLVQTLSPIDSVLKTVQSALEGAYAFPPTGNIDLIGFVRLLLDGPLPEASRQAAQHVLAQWSRIVVATAVPGDARGPNGLSIYAPSPTAFDPDYLRLINTLPWGLGIWSWFLASYYLKVLGTDSGNALLETMQRTMQQMIRTGQYVPPG